MQPRSVYEWEECWSKASTGHYRDPYERQAFDETGSDYGGDSDDDEDSCEPDYAHETWLSTTGDHHENPIAIEILDHLLDLPSCKKAAIMTMRGLLLRRGYRPRHDPKGRIFDSDYMLDLWRTLELWMRGERGM